MPEYYILKEDASIEKNDDVTIWGRMYETKIRNIATNYTNGIKVSTIFLGIDHNFGQYNFKPAIFKTMIFGGEHDQSEWRYSTVKEALRGHVKACILAGVDHGIDI